MSSRALRKLQKQQEEERLAKLQESAQASEEEDDEEEQEVFSRSVKANAFDFLNNDNDDENDSERDGEAAENEAAQGEDTQGHEDSDHMTDQTKAQSSAKKKKAKKRKKKAVKDSAATDEAKPGKESEGGLDDIDAALQALKAKSGGKNEEEAQTIRDPEIEHLYKLLSIDSRNLNALNEMKKLFGSVVLEGREDEAAAGRRRQRVTQTVDLGAALTARYSVVARGQGLTGLALRRNVFMPGKEEWPRVSSGGLGMELVEKAWDGTIEYRFVHVSAYQETQRQFDICVESMDPQRMIALLQQNPYHISTLLQVSEIAKQQGDASVAGDLLERALFSFGRSVHSTFGNAMSEGKARLDFRRPENREFWLAIWRYIGSLGQRGTWRTAYEWAKLLLSLDPEGDPYCIHLVLDYFALRGGQAEQFKELASIPSSSINWGQDSVNIQISLGLAENRLKHAQESRSQLASTVKRYPWVFARLFQQLDIKHTPKAVWGTEPRTVREKLETEAYVTRAKDIWNTPEAVSFLVEVAESVESNDPLPPVDDAIDLNEARHIILSEIPPLIGLLPRSITTQRISASDPFPPLDNLPSYSTSTTAQENDDEDDPEQDPNPARDASELQGLQSWFSGMLNRLGFRVSGVGEPPVEGETPPLNTTEDDLARALADSNITPDEFVEQAARLQRLQDRVSRRHAAAQQQAAGQEREVDAEFAFADTEEGRAQQEFIMRAIQEEQAAGESDQQPGSVAAAAQAQPTALQAHVSDDDDDNDDASSLPPSHPEPEPEVYDDQRNQRWLVGQGTQRLKDFIAEHGTNEKAWGPSVDDSPVVEYVERVRRLERKVTKQWIIDNILQQRAGSEARDLIRRLSGVS